jgi:hypothetical protein
MRSRLKFESMKSCQHNGKTATRLQTTPANQPINFSIAVMADLASRPASGGCQMLRCGE